MSSVRQVASHYSLEGNAMDQDQAAFNEYVRAAQAEFSGYAARLAKLVERGVMTRRESRQLIAVHAFESGSSQDKDT